LLKKISKSDTMVNVFIPYGDFTVEERGKGFVVLKKGKVIFRTRNKEKAVALAKKKGMKRNWRK